MKTSIFFLLLFAFAGVNAQDNKVWPVSLQKDYSKSYPVGTENIVLLNRYGKMRIETWDKQEVSVEAHISMSAQNKDYATKMLETINVKDKIKDGSIVYETELAVANTSSDENNTAHEFHIDWTVHVPANAKLHAENHFGPLTIGDYKGESEIISRYGSLTAGKLSNCKELRIDFGRAQISSLADSRINFRYSRIEIGKMSGKIEGEMQFCNSIDLPVDSGLKQLILKTGYTSLYLMMAKDISADYDISTNNARVTAKNNMSIKEEQEQPKNDNDTRMVRMVSFSPNHHYAGSLGKGGGLKIEIKSNFGNIRVTDL
jgi:hypothetical protein